MREFRLLGGQNEVWISDDMSLWDVTDPTDVLLVSERLRVSVRFLDESVVRLQGVLPIAGPYLEYLTKGHIFHITRSECGPREDYYGEDPAQRADYYGREQVVVSLTDCDKLTWWVEELVPGTPDEVGTVYMMVELSCTVEFFFDGGGEHVG